MGNKKAGSSEERLSVFLSLVLRHQPEAAGITLDEHGWADVEDLIQGISGTGRPMDMELLEDVVIELKQAYNTVNIYSDILTGTMDAFASIISNNVNAIMKRMTSLSITLMIPTLIASFYGMNVDIHLEGFPYAFIFIILISVILSAGTFIWFRKIKWF